MAHRAGRSRPKNSDESEKTASVSLPHRESQGDRRHPARRARHQHIAGVSGNGEKKRCTTWPGLARNMITTHLEPDPAPFKVYLLTKAGRVMRARSEPVRAFSTKDEAARFAGRQLGGHYAVYHKDRKIWPIP
jgi:hypothetical protein